MFSPDAPGRATVDTTRAILSRRMARMPAVPIEWGGPLAVLALGRDALLRGAPGRLLGRLGGGGGGVWRGGRWAGLDGLRRGVALRCGLHVRVVHEIARVVDVV